MKSGFTMIELLIVIAIMVMTSVITIPKLFQSISKAKDSIVIKVISVMRSSAQDIYIDNSAVKYPENIKALNITDNSTIESKIEDKDTITEPGDSITSIQILSGTVSKGGTISVGVGAFSEKRNVAEIIYNNENGTIYADGVNGNGYKDTLGHLWSSY